MIENFEEAMAALQSASRSLFSAAHAGEGCCLTGDESAALAGAIMNLTRTATLISQVERN